LQGQGWSRELAQAIPDLVQSGQVNKGLANMAAILLAEDDDSMRRFLKKALERAGHTVIDASQGDEALTELQLREFDLLLTDIVMPVMDGIELARRAAEIDPEMKIMFITGFAAVALNAANQAPDDAKVLSKPFHLKDLVQEVDRVIAA
jgi:two-component system cell cycle response regulator CpdR